MPLPTNNHLLSRRECLVQVPAAVGALASLSLSAAVNAGAQNGTAPQRGLDVATPAAGVSGAFPSADPRLVSEMVGASHSRVERVKELLAQAPQLANAAWDWGFGDWETALGAASHVGNRTIAALLIERGARADIFAHAMLGNLDAVRAAVACQPGIERTRGPHGLTLMHHARAGGDGAAAVVAYLGELAGSDEPYAEVPLSEPTRSAVVGEYAWGPAPDQRLRVFVPERQQRLSVARNDGASIRLFHVAEGIFHPAGAPDVRLHFAIDGAQATRLTIATPAQLLVAARST